MVGIFGSKKISTLHGLLKRWSLNDPIKESTNPLCFFSIAGLEEMAPGVPATFSYPSVNQSYSTMAH
jgi:hypothetical protein